MSFQYLFEGMILFGHVFAIPCTLVVEFLETKDFLLQSFDVQLLAFSVCSIPVSN